MKSVAEAGPFYDPKLPYGHNYDKGPFGAFRSVPESVPKVGGYELFGIPLDIPFGIPAGPLLTSKFVEAAWHWGFSIATYKTVRGDEYPTHPWPNVIRVTSPGKDIHPGDTVLGIFDMNSIDVTRDGITNSFGVPSKDAATWQQDARCAIAAAKPGDVMILSFMGTKRENQTRDAYIKDFADTLVKVRETGAKIAEVNFSCPNFGKEGLICNDVAMSRDILEELHAVKGNIPLLVKIGYFGEPQRTEIEALLDAIHEYADGVVGINTIGAKVVDETGKQALPGSQVRLSSGICGAAIRWAGLEMADRLVAYKKKKGWKEFIIIGVGGVTKPEDYFKYMHIGVDAVQSATGAMWRPTLALEIREQLAKSL